MKISRRYSRSIFLLLLVFDRKFLTGSNGRFGIYPHFLKVFLKEGQKNGNEKSNNRCYHDI